MNKYEELTEYDLLTKVCSIKTEFGGRENSILDGYRGQFFWHINDVNCSDWDASYIFENGSVNLGDEARCKILLSENVKKYSKGVFLVGRQFAIREGSKIVAVGLILESKVKKV